jgi:hypothetical protein
MVRSRKAEAETQQPEGPDVFDEQIAARAEAMQNPPQTPDTRVAEIVESVAESTRMPTNGHTATVAKKQYKRQADPFGGHIIDLSEEKDAPQARFLRSNDNQAMLLQFSENPGKEITDQLKDAGFHWEPRANSDFAKGAWIINLEPGREWRNHAHAEKVFQDVVNQIRDKNGMDPFVPGAAQSAG